MFLVRLVPAFLINFSWVVAQEPEYVQVFFANSRMTGNYFYSKTSYQSPSWIRNIQNKLPVTETYFFTPGNCLQLNYVNGQGSSWNALIIRPQWRGQTNLKVGNTLHIKLLITTAGTSPQDLPAIQIGKDDSIFSKPLSLSGYVTQVQMKKWIAIAIPLKDFQGLSYEKPSEIVGFNFIQNNTDGKEHSLMLDDIEILPNVQPVRTTTIPVIRQVRGFANHADIEWNPISDSSIKYVKIYRSYDGKTFTPVGVQLPYIHRYADYIWRDWEDMYIIKFPFSGMIIVKADYPLRFCQNKIHDR